MQSTQPIVHIEVQVSIDDAPLRSPGVLIHLTLDPRFQVVRWVPYGATKLRHCALWAEEDGER